jgi:hypothetical protein
MSQSAILGRPHLKFEADFIGILSCPVVLLVACPECERFALSPRLHAFNSFGGRTIGFSGGWQEVSCNRNP